VLSCWRWDYSSCSFVGLGITPTFDKEFIINDAFKDASLLSLRLFIADGEQSTAFHRIDASTPRKGINTVTS